MPFVPTRPDAAGNAPAYLNASKPTPLKTEIDLAATGKNPMTKTADGSLAPPDWPGGMPPGQSSASVPPLPPAE